MLARNRFCSIVLALSLGAAAKAADLSPARWDTAVRAQAEAREAAVWPATRRTITGTREMISATASPIAVEAGMETLRQGGNAADAAVATALTQVTTMLGANVSFAGVAQILYFNARTKKVYLLDAGWNSWRGERDPASIPEADLSLVLASARGVQGGADGRKMLVPGFMAGMEALHRRFGLLKWKGLFAPSIAYARDGVPATPLLSAYFAMARSTLERTAEGRAFAAAGASRLIVVPGLADTLRAVADHGAHELYRGAWARHFVEAVSAHGGAASMADMAAYRPQWRTPLTLPFQGGTVVAPDESNISACVAMMALNILGRTDPAARYWEDAKAYSRIARAMWLSLNAASPAVVALDKELGTGGGCRAHPWRWTRSSAPVADAGRICVTISAGLPSTGSAAWIPAASRAARIITPHR